MNSPRVRKVAADAGYPFGKNTNRVDAFSDEMRLALERGDAVKLAGFGGFPVTRQGATPGPQPEDRRRNPYQGASCRYFSRQRQVKGGCWTSARAEADMSVEYVSRLL